MLKRRTALPARSLPSAFQAWPRPRALASRPPRRPLRPGRLDRYVGALLAERMATDLGKTIVVENRPGGGTMVGMVNVAKSKPDGNSLLLMTTTAALLPAFDMQLAIDPQKDLTPVSQLADIPSVLAVNAKQPGENLPRVHRVAKGPTWPRPLFDLEHRRPAAPVGRAHEAPGPTASCSTSPTRPPPRRCATP